MAIMLDDDLAALVLDAASEEALGHLRANRNGFFVAAVRLKEPDLNVTDIRRAIPLLRELAV